MTLPAHSVALPNRSEAFAEKEFAPVAPQSCHTATESCQYQHLAAPVWALRRPSGIECDTQTSICARQSRSKAFSRPYPTPPYPTPIPRNRLRGLRNPITHAHRVPSAAECLRCLSLKAKQLVKGHKFVVVAPCDGGHRTGGDTRLVEAPCGVGTLGGTAIGVCQL